MKRTLKFSKAFLPCAIASAVIIVFGIAGLLFRGINFGLEFVPGLIEEVRIAPPAIEVTYEGASSVTVSAGRDAFSLVITSASSDAESVSFPYTRYPTVQDVADGLNETEGVTASVRGAATQSAYGIYLNNTASFTLSDTPLYVYAVGEEGGVSAEDVRAALSALDVEVRELGADGARSFQIRTARAGGDVSSAELQESITGALKAAFGDDDVATVRTDFVGSSFSGSIALRSVVLAVVTLLAIWLYATIRFHWDFALGAVIALVHDCLIMFTYIAWTQVEFSATTFAAVLTIFGYSINATVVILDRVRENMRLMNTRNFNDILNASLSETLSRSIITTVTTLFAAVALLIFTSGSIRDFAQVLTVGLVSGCYSSIFISSGFISLMRRHWVPSDGARVRAPRERKRGAESASLTKA